MTGEDLYALYVEASGGEGSCDPWEVLPEHDHEVWERLAREVRPV